MSKRTDPTKPPENIPPALRRPEKTDVPRLALRLWEAADCLGIDKKTLSDMDDGPPVFRKGALILYPVDGLREWLALKSKRQSASGES